MKETILFVFGIAFLVGYIVWMFYEASFDNYCHTKTNPYINLDFQTWTIVNGGTALGGYGIVIIFYLLGCLGSQCKGPRTFRFLFYWLVLHCLFELIWNIIGSVLYWGYYQKQCTQLSTDIKIILALIFGYNIVSVEAFIAIFLIKEDKKHRDDSRYLDLF